MSEAFRGQPVLIGNYGDATRATESIISEHLEPYEGTALFAEEGPAANDILERIIQEDPVIRSAWERELIERAYPRQIERDKRMLSAVKRAALERISYDRP